MPTHRKHPPMPEGGPPIPEGGPDIPLGAFPLATTPPPGRGWMSPGDNIRYYPTVKITPGRAGRAIKAVVLHIADGGFWGSLSWLQGMHNPDSSSTFMIDSDTGMIVQLASIYDGTWANGLRWDAKTRRWYDPEKHLVNPPWPLLEAGVSPNFTTVSIEASGKPKDKMTALREQATLRILRFVAQETGLVYIPRRTLIGHMDISPIARSFCPGPNVDFTKLAAAVSQPVTPITPPRPLGNYHAKAQTFVYEIPQADPRRIALSGVARLMADDNVVVDSWEGGFAHLAANSPTLANVGFVDGTMLVDGHRMPATPPPPSAVVPAVTRDSLLISPPRAHKEQAIAFLKARGDVYPAYDIETIVSAYWSLCQSVGLDPLLAVAQMAHETGSLTSWWCQRPRRNPCGFGVTGRSAHTKLPGVWQPTDDKTGWVEGHAFPSWANDAVPAHIGRLLAYALTDEMANAAQAKLIRLALGLRPLPAHFRGVAATLQGLNGRWAVPGTTYAESIAKVANAIRATA